MKVKLDLHTHVWEASGFAPPSPELARRVIRQARAAGIDGIAITDHWSTEFAFAFKEVVDEHFPGQLLVFPGREIDVRPRQDYFARYEVTEFWLDGGRLFRSYSHPGYPSQRIYIENIQAIEIDNPLHRWHIDAATVRALARQHDLLLLSVSDAHRIEDIGCRYTEVDLEELYARALSVNAAVES